MKRLLILSLITASTLGISGCGDTGERMIKAAAKAIIEEEDKANEPSAVTGPNDNPPEIVYSQEPSSNQPQDETVYYEPQGSIAPDPSSNAYENLPPKPAPAPVAASSGLTETVVRYRANVLTQYGGKVLVRQAPSKTSKKLGFLYDQEEVWVIGETNKCEVINRIEGCWVKVMDVNRLVGYSFGGYLQY